MLTKKGQTAQELADEFISALAAMDGDKVGQMNALFDYFVSLEKKRHCPTSLLDTVHRRNNGAFDAMSIDVIQKHRMPVSTHLMAWLATQSANIPSYLDTFIGMLAMVFYRTHRRDEAMTLEWLGTVGGRGKIINCQQMFPWALSAQIEDGRNIYTVISDDELYTRDVNTK